MFVKQQFVHHGNDGHTALLTREEWQPAERGDKDTDAQSWLC